MCPVIVKFSSFRFVDFARRQPCCNLTHRKNKNFSTDRVVELKKNKLFVRKGKSAVNTLCIHEHFNALLREICLFKPLGFNSPVLDREHAKYLNSTEYLSKADRLLHLNNKIIHSSNEKADKKNNIALQASGDLGEKGFRAEKALKNVNRKVKIVDQKIKNNAPHIIDTAKQFGVNPAILAATIYAEQRLNVTSTEELEDWTQMMLGMDCSVGLSQVRISTAKALEEKGYMPKTEKTSYTQTWGGKSKTYVISREENIYYKLANNKTNIEYAAAELKYRQDLWKNQYPEVDGRTAILATLYNLGDKAGFPHSNPKSNDFGNFAKDNYYYMRNLLGLD